MTRKAKRIHDVDCNGSCTTKNHLPLELARAALGRGGKIRGSGRKRAQGRDVASIATGEGADCANVT